MASQRQLPSLGETGTERPGGARAGQGWWLAASVLTRASERGAQAGAQGGAAWTCTVTYKPGPSCLSDSPSGMWGNGGI